MTGQAWTQHSAENRVVQFLLDNGLFIAFVLEAHSLCRSRSRPLSSGRER